MTSSFLIVGLIVFIAFLGVLGLLSLAVTKSVNPDGRSSRGAFGGCASALVLVFLTGMGAVGTGAFVVATTVGTVVEANPIARIEVRRGSDARDDGMLASEVADTEIGDRTHDDRHGPVHLLFTVRGDAGRELVRMVQEVIDVEQMDLDLDELLTIHQRQGSDGTEFEIFEFHLPVSTSDLEELEREIEHELDGLRVHLPESVVIHFEGAERFY